MRRVPRNFSWPQDEAAQREMLSKRNLSPDERDLLWEKMPLKDQEKYRAHFEASAALIRNSGLLSVAAMQEKLDDINNRMLLPENLALHNAKYHLEKFSKEKVLEHLAEFKPEVQKFFKEHFKFSTEVASGSLQTNASALSRTLLNLLSPPTPSSPLSAAVATPLTSVVDHKGSAIARREAGLSKQIAREVVGRAAFPPSGLYGPSALFQRRPLPPINTSNNDDCTVLMGSPRPDSSSSTSS